MMLIYTDVSADPTALRRSRLREAQLAEANALGFGATSFIAAVPDAALSEGQDPVAVLLSAVMFDAHRAMTLSLSHTDEVGDDYCLKTLFTDGSIIMTESEPQKNRVRLKLGVTSAPRYGVDLAFVEMTSLADLVAAHERRVDAHRSPDREPIASHDLRAHLAMKKRWREIADARMRWQTKIAMAFGVVTMLITIAGPLVGIRAIAGVIGESLAYMLVTAGTLGGVPLGFGAFVFALLYVAPIFARLAPAPAMRPARELLPLADTVARGAIPVASRATSPRLPRPDIARLQHNDLIVTMASAMFLPLVGIATHALFGNARAWLAISVILTLDAMVQIVAKKTRTDLLRERYVPELVRAEAAVPEIACGGAACAIPNGVGVFLRLALGVLGIVVATRLLALPREPFRLDAIGQWTIVAIFVFVTVLSRTKARHAKLVSS
jgi:hypothetical protein